MQKEKLSALMDGETLDNELLASLSKDADLQKSWESYHLIRDTLRGDVGEVLHFDISARVAAAIENEPVRKVTSLIPEAQPEPSRWQKMPFWRRGGGWVAQVTQIGVAACVSLAVIVGVQHYNSSPAGSATETSDAPAFNTLPMMGKASPVSLGVPSDAFDTNSSNQQVQEQRRRVNAMLQDYELQRRLHADQVQFESNAPQQAQANVPGTQSLGTQQQ
ncbi:anti-RNA polymerase sigma factor SigE [Pantoea dispersa EGD-AAK13]|jgi:sigma-E factor negative regulatory protein RseA|uniref:Anti-sigma-E factor RseA n=1 Tax=Pantoea dispersa TaxID=59814 RepID=A0ABY2ZV63_9GAMM|nr:MULTISPECIES: anti-sigma-E factor RseA [Pantoea]MBK4768384.1 anti-sigma-E factor RseA [Pantoea sp. Morm]ERH66639.1 anti-RNA polymerase sigma factor SigE [Pantoea dispersa EGD-AAK13]KAA6101868.1 anti-sigma-E factor RseA [Pantoea sp. B_9]KAA6115741.1 anti-sigma-E factor RseA [Pantoea sp. B_10]KAF0853311.1 anti-RNA polymerase sigma factor SigE [Pantoea dispersa 625]